MNAIQVHSFKPTAANHALACEDVEQYVNELVFDSGTGSATLELVSLSCANVGGEQPWRFTIVLRSTQR